MSIIKKLAAGLLTLTMIFSFTACTDTSWAAKADDYQVRAGVYIYYTIIAYSEAQGKLTADQKDLFSATIEEKDAKTWIKDSATEKVKNFIAVEKEFDKLGLTLSDSDNNKIKVSSDSVWAQNGTMFEKNGISQQSISDVVKNTYKSKLVFNKYYDTDGLEAVPEDDIKSYYDENNARVKYIAIQLKDGEGNLFKSADKLKAMEMAEDYKSRATADNFDDLIKEYNDYYAKVVADATAKADSSSKDETATDEAVDEYANEQIITKDGTVPSEKVSKAIFADAKVGVPTIIKDDEVYYVVLRLDLLERTDLYDSNRESILYTMKSEEYQKKVDELAASLDLTKNKDSYKRYDPEKLDLATTK